MQLRVSFGEIRVGVRWLMHTALSRLGSPLRLHMTAAFTDTSKSRSVFVACFLSHLNVWISLACPLCICVDQRLRRDVFGRSFADTLQCLCTVCRVCWHGPRCCVVALFFHVLKPYSHCLHDSMDEPQRHKEVRPWRC